MLLGSSVLFEGERSMQVQARRLVNKSAISLAKDEPKEEKSKDEEEGDDSEKKEKDHPPKEVSHFTQD